MEYKELIDCYFDSIIKKSETNAKKRNAPEYEKLYDAPREKLSFAGADEIERLSWDTTMRLCDTEEYREEPEKTPAPVPQPVPEVQEPDKPTADTYGLSKADIAYISSLIESSEKRECGIDDEATVERINEAFSDGFGDVIIENDGDGFRVIEDYQEEIREWLKNI